MLDVSWIFSEFLSDANELHYFVMGGALGFVVGWITSRLIRPLEVGK